jgi:hypothetical protein
VRQSPLFWRWATQIFCGETLAQWVRQSVRTFG